MWKTSDPELLPVGLTRCPECKTRMVTAAVEEGPEGFEHRSFECFRCGHSEQNCHCIRPDEHECLGLAKQQIASAEVVVASGIRPLPQHSLHGA